VVDRGYCCWFSTGRARRCMRRESTSRGRLDRAGISLITTFRIHRALPARPPRVTIVDGDHGTRVPVGRRQALERQATDRQASPSSFVRGGGTRNGPSGRAASRRAPSSPGSRMAEGDVRVSAPDLQWPIYGETVARRSREVQHPHATALQNGWRRRARRLDRVSCSRRRRRRVSSGTRGTHIRGIDARRKVL